jgi:hypothetical protein
MQAAKDTFLKTLANRLAVMNPSRTVTMDGVTRPAVVAMENETATATNAPVEAFLLNWEAAGEAAAGGTLRFLDCKLMYSTKGTQGVLYCDRGRIATAMHSELTRILEPCCAEKSDYTQQPPTPLGTRIFWGAPAIAAESDVDGVLSHTVAVRVFYFPEAA